MFDLRCSAICNRKCLNDANKPSDRWSHVACNDCCMLDINSDGFVTREDLGQGYDAFCGLDEDSK